MSLQLALRGHFDQAKAVEREALDSAAEFAHPQTTGNFFAYKLLRGEFQQDYSEQAETQAALSRHAEEHKIVFWSLWADIFRGFAAARAGRASEGIQMIDRSLKVFAEMKFTYYRSYHLGLKARAYELGGDIESALVTINEAIAFAKDSGEKVVLADLTRLSGELHLARSAGAAENLFSEAIALALVQASKLHELRAATSMARLLRKQFKRETAENLLRSVYDWFTEGLDAPDLSNARSVMADISADLRHEHV
jgi:predicted ATPase